MLGQRRGDGSDGVFKATKRVKHFLCHCIIHRMRGKASILDGRRLLLWRRLIDLNEGGASDLVRLIFDNMRRKVDVLEQLRPGSQRISQLIHHLTSLLLDNPRIASEWCGLLVFGALLIDKSRRVDIQIVVL